MRTATIFIFTLLLFSLQAYSQTKQPGDFPKIGIVSGRILDKDTRHPVEYATVVLYKARDSSFVSGSVTDKKGYYRMENLPIGMFYLKISFIGYGSEIISGIKITPQNPEYIVSDFYLSAEAVNMKEFNITETRPMIHYQLDKKIINVDKNLTALGGTAVDLLKTVPSVNVDIDGNITIRGSGNLTILIDGKPSAFAGGPAILEQIPASSVVSIELITNPSAKYDPEGMSGIINIITKQEKLDGLYGLVSVNSDLGQRFNSTITLNYKYKKISTNISYSFRNDIRAGSGNVSRITHILDSFTYLNQEGSRRGISQVNSLRAGVDWQLNPKTTLSYSGTYRTNFGTGNDTNKSMMTAENDVFIQNYWFLERDKDKGHSFDNSLDFKRIFKDKGHELTSSVSYSFSDPISKSNLDQIFFNADWTTSSIDTPVNEKINTDNYSSNFNWQIDYSRPLKKESKLETGAKLLLRESDRDYHYLLYDHSNALWNENYMKSNHFLMDEQLISVYGIFSSKLKSFQYQVGARIEDAIVKSQQKTSLRNYRKEYFSLFPSFSISREIKKGLQTQLSYSRRVNRPRVDQMNPFIQYMDPYNISYGNPKLGPEYTSSYELSVSRVYKKAFLSPTLFYRTTTEMITRYQTLLPSGVTESTYRNSNRSTSMGLELVYNRDIYKWWKMTSDLSFYKYIIDASNLESDLGGESYSWTFRTSMNWNLPKSASLQLMANYRSPVIMPQGKRYDMFFIDFGGRKDIWKNQASITLKLSDVFNTWKFRFDSEGQGFTSQYTRKRVSRILMLGFTYKINGGIKQRERKRPEENGNIMDDMFE